MDIPKKEDWEAEARLQAIELLLRHIIRGLMLQFPDPVAALQRFRESVDATLSQETLGTREPALSDHAIGELQSALRALLDGVSVTPAAARNQEKPR